VTCNERGPLVARRHSGGRFCKRDAAVAASLALQFGCPLEVLQRALLRDSHGRPSTPLGAAIDRIAGGAT
jgi:hypothetical protein